MIGMRRRNVKDRIKPRLPKLGDIDALDRSRLDAFWGLYMTTTQAFLSVRGLLLRQGAARLKGKKWLLRRILSVLRP